MILNSIIGQDSIRSDPKYEYNLQAGNFELKKNIK